MNISTHFINTFCHNGFSITKFINELILCSMDSNENRNRGHSSRRIGLKLLLTNTSNTRE